MKPHPRIRKMVKWGGGAATVLLVFLSVWGGWLAASISPRSGVEAFVWAGHVTVLRSDLGPGNRAVGPHVWFGTRTCAFEYWRSLHGSSSTLDMPLWPAAAFALLVTGIAWRLDTLARRRARVGFCPKCNYDRIGLAAGAVCPECGAAAVAPPPAAS